VAGRTAPSLSRSSTLATWNRPSVTECVDVSCPPPASDRDWPVPQFRLAFDDAPHVLPSQPRYPPLTFRKSLRIAFGMVATSPSPLRRTTQVRPRGASAARRADLVHGSRRLLPDEKVAPVGCGPPNRQILEPGWARPHACELSGPRPRLVRCRKARPMKPLCFDKLGPT